MKALSTRSKSVQLLKTALTAVLLMLIGGAIGTAQQKVTRASQPTPQSESSNTNTSRSQQIMVNTDLVTLTVSVTDDQGRYVPGLSKKEFTITDNKAPQEISFFSDADSPVSVGIVFDVSGSMSGNKIERAQAALTGFIETSHQEDEYFLIGFNSQPQLLLNRSRSAEAVIDKLTFVKPQGSTALYDATYLALEHVTRGSHKKRALLIISDGQDNNSRYTFSQLRRALKESDVLIYAVGIEGPTPGDVLDVFGKMLLSELAVSSGGRMFFPANTAALIEALETIALELRHQYSIGYRPSNFVADSKWHRVKVKVSPPRELKRVFVRSREGYYAVGSQR